MSNAETITSLEIVAAANRAFADLLGDECPIAGHLRELADRAQVHVTSDPDVAGCQLRLIRIASAKAAKAASRTIPPDSAHPAAVISQGLSLLHDREPDDTIWELAWLGMEQVATHLPTYRGVYRPMQVVSHVRRDDGTPGDFVRVSVENPSPPPTAEATMKVSEFARLSGLNAGQVSRLEEPLTIDNALRIWQQRDGRRKDREETDAEVERKFRL